MKKLLNIYLQEDMEENVAPNHDGKAAPYGSGYDDIDEGHCTEEEIEEGTCGYSEDGKPKNKPAGPHLMRERFKELAGLKPLYEQDNFDQRLAQQMGMSDDEFEDEIASRDIGDGGSSFPGTDEVSNGYKAAQALKDELRNITYKKLSQEEIDTFSKEMILHFLDNTTAAAAAKIHFGKKGI